MKIANIIYEKELINHTKVEYINYYNESIGYDNIDKTIPTLYVGWSFMKNCNLNNDVIQNADVLQKDIIKNQLYWACSYQEGKAAHIKGVINFIKNISEYYFASKYTYINVDPVFYQIKGITDLMNVLPTNIDVMYIMKNESIYALYNNKIYGINLLTYKYFKFDIEDIIFRITERTQTTYNDSEGITYQKYYKIFPNFILLKRYIVVLLSK